MQVYKVTKAAHLTVLGNLRRNDFQMEAGVSFSSVEEIGYGTVHNCREFWNYIANQTDAVIS